MKNIFHSQKQITWTKTILCLLMVAVCVSGCEPLRKKFVRKKKMDKKEQTDFVPVLEPVDYPEYRPSAESKYKHHYQLWKVWQKDLITSLEENGPKKRLRFIVAQIIGQLEELSKLLSEDKQRQMTKHIQSYEKVNDLVDQPDSMRDYLAIERRTNRIGRELREHFVYAKMKDHIRE